MFSGSAPRASVPIPSICKTGHIPSKYFASLCGIPVLGYHWDSRSPIAKPEHANYNLDDLDDLPTLACRILSTFKPLPSMRVDLALPRRCPGWREIIHTSAAKHIPFAYSGCSQKASRHLAAGLAVPKVWAHRAQTTQVHNSMWHLPFPRSEIQIPCLGFFSDAQIIVYLPFLGLLQNLISYLPNFLDSAIRICTFYFYEIRIFSRLSYSVFEL
jgi:hypothetical protein